jgi:hypothetical protein
LKEKERKGLFSKINIFLKGLLNLDAYRFCAFGNNNKIRCRFSFG